MTRFLSVYLYGGLLMITGFVILLFSSHLSLEVNRYIVSILVLISFVLASFASYLSLPHHVQSNYHALHALGLFVYGIAILYYTYNLNDFIYYTSFFLLFYGLAEIIFCFILFNLKLQLKTYTLISRIVLGLFVSIGAVLLQAITEYEPGSIIITSGILFIIIGIQIIMYVPIVKKNTTRSKP
jgi:hypothetical protein